MLKSILRWLCGAAAGLALQGAVAQTISIGGVGAGSPIHWPIYIATAKGFYHQLGVEVKFTPIASSANVVQQAVAGSLDIAVSGPGDALRAINQGASLTLLRVEVRPSGYEIFAKKPIKTIADLRGKLIMIGGPKDITRYYMEALLRHGGLKPGDYDYIYAGATSQRFAALVSGSIDATILTAPFNFTARSEKYTDLGPPPPETERVPFAVFTLRPAWARQHAAEVQKFLDGFRQGVDYFYNPKNADEVIDILQKASNAPRADVAKTYTYYRGIKMFDRVGAITADDAHAIVQLLHDQGDPSVGAESALARAVTPGITVTGR
jgi:ABC-type nitrate/sulfonate/bicarbonate transport system substrate-binding protein